MSEQATSGIPANKEETLGAIATRIATEHAKQWLDDTLAVIRKTVLGMAQRGLFHCTLRFEDQVPQDLQNQQRLMKILVKENLNAEFKAIVDSENETKAVELTITWGPHLL